MLKNNIILSKHDIDSACFSSRVRDIFLASPIRKAKINFHGQKTQHDCKSQNNINTSTVHETMQCIKPLL